MRNVALLSDLELTILGLVRLQPRSGYDLRKEIAASPGAVYPALKRLASAGMLEARPDPSSGRKKETFHITTAGRKALQTALQKPAMEEVRGDPQAVAARLRFLTGKASMPFVEEYGRLSAICAAELKGRTDLLSSHDAELYAARARWAAKAAKALTRRPS